MVLARGKENKVTFAGVSKVGPKTSHWGGLCPLSNLSLSQCYQVPRWSRLIWLAPQAGTSLSADRFSCIKQSGNPISLFFKACVSNSANLAVPTVVISLTRSQCVHWIWSDSESGSVGPVWPWHTAVRPLQCVCCKSRTCSAGGAV